MPLQTQVNDELERRLAEQDIFRQSLGTKQERIEELESEVRYLRDLLNSALAVPRTQLAPAAPQPRRLTPVPKRWNVR